MNLKIFFNNYFNLIKIKSLLYIKSKKIISSKIYILQIRKEIFIEIRKEI